MNEKIICLHGLGSTKHLFDELKINLAKESVESLDLPGHGETKMLEDMSIDSLCSWLNNKIENPSIIAGHSLGAVISLAFADRYPQKVKQLILLDGGYLYSKMFDVPLEAEINGAKQYVENTKFSSIEEMIEAEKVEAKRWSPLLEYSTVKRFKKTAGDTYQLIIDVDTATTYTRLFYDFDIPLLHMPITLIAAMHPYEIEEIRNTAIKKLKEKLPQTVVKKIDTSHDLLAEDPFTVANIIEELI